MDFLTKDECAPRITALGQSAKLLNDEIHLLACSTLEHVRVYGDYTLAERLVNCLPSGQRVETLAKWFKVYSNGKLEFRKLKASNVRKGDLKKDRVDADFDMVSAVATPFGDMETEIVQKQVTLEVVLKYLRTKANNTTQLKPGVDAVAPEARAIISRMLAFIGDTKVEAEIRSAV